MITRLFHFELLALKLFGVQISEEVNWSFSDFVFMGGLLAIVIALLILVAKKVPKKSHRIILGVVVILAFLYVWAELAVGIFTNVGS